MLSQILLFGLFFSVATNVGYRFATLVISSDQGNARLLMTASTTRSPRDAFLNQSIWGDKAANTPDIDCLGMPYLIASSSENLLAPTYQYLARS